MTEAMLVIFGLVVGFYLGALVIALMADRRVGEERARCQRLHPAAEIEYEYLWTAESGIVSIPKTIGAVVKSSWSATNDGVTVNVEPVET